MSDEIEALKQFHRRFATGVTIVTTRGREGEPRGLVVNAFSSLSLDPPVVMVCVARSSSTSRALFESEHFSVNILATTHKELVAAFSTPQAERFSQGDWVDGPHGTPVLADAVGSVEARIVERLVGASHTVFLGRVESTRVSAGTPLLYAYGRLHDRPLEAMEG